jgi:uncharacterized membrane protein YhiD involved in acid resistance
MMIQAAWFVQSVFRVIMMLGALALTINLYRMAMKHEKNHCDKDTDKIAYLNQVEEIQERVEEIFKNTSKDSQSSDICFKDQKLVAWLLNRSKEAQSSERHQLFADLNKEMSDEYNFYLRNDGD